MRVLSPLTQLITILTASKMFRAVKSQDDEHDRTSTVFQFSRITAPATDFPKAPIYFHYSQTKKSEPNGPEGAVDGNVVFSVLHLCVFASYIAQCVAYV